MFWDLYGLKGHPIRTTVSEIGPLLLARMLNLNDVQEGVLSVVFHVADTEGLLLLDLDDLRSLLVYVGENAERIGREVGNVAPASIAAIQRALLQVEQQGGDAFFGEPALKLEDMIRVGLDGRGQVNVLDATKLMNSPRLYAAFLLWLLSELFEQLPEVGDPDKPVLVFFFDAPTRSVGRNNPLKAYNTSAAPKARTTHCPPSMPSHRVPAPVPKKIASSIGHSLRSSARRCPPNASCQRLVRVDGMISRAAACTGAIARPSKPMAIVGRPRPITPLTVPATRNVPITSNDRAGPRS